MAKISVQLGTLVAEAVAAELVGKKNSKGNPYHTTGNMIVRLATEDLPENVKALGIGSANVTICVNAWPTKVSKVVDPIDAITKNTLKRFEADEKRLKDQGKWTEEVANQFASLRERLTGKVE